MSVIWITGLSGAGKTTLSNAVRDLLKEKGRFVIQLDGDEVRATVNSELGYTAEDRRTHIVRMQQMARLIAQQGADVIVSALYFDDEIGQWNKDNIDHYLEVYIEASMELLGERDQKNLYSKFHSQKANNIIGLDIPYSAPRTPHIIFSADERIEPKLMAVHIYNKLEGLRELKNAS